MRRGGVERQRGRPRGAQRGVEVRVKPAGLAQLGQDVSCGESSCRASAGRCRGPARPPPRRRPGSARRWPAGRTGPATPRPRAAVACALSGLDEPEAGPDRAGDDVALPRAERVGQERHLGGGGGEPALRAGQRGEPGAGVALSRPEPVRRPQPGPRQRRPGGGVDQAVHRVDPDGQGLVRLDRRQRRGQAGDQDRAQAASGPVRTGRQVARGPSAPTPGSSRPRPTRSYAKRLSWSRWENDVARGGAVRVEAARISAADRRRTRPPGPATASRGHARDCGRLVADQVG